MKTRNLSVEIAGILLKTPLVASSGSWGKELVPFGMKAWGAVVLKTITLSPHKGNPPPRLAEAPCGLLNSIGLENEGVDCFIKEELPAFKNISLPRFASIAGFSMEEYWELAYRLNEAQDISAVEVNISCPNLKNGGMTFGQDPYTVESLIKGIKKVSRFPIVPKLTPNVTDITSVALACEAAGADALSMVNTYRGMLVDIHTRKPKLGNIYGGFSGPAIKPLALYALWEVAQKVNIPIIGGGGIISAEDVLEFIIAGASAVGIGTLNLIDPEAPLEILHKLEDYMYAWDIDDINLLRNTLVVERSSENER